MQCAKVVVIIYHSCICEGSEGIKEVSEKQSIAGSSADIAGRFGNSEKIVRAMSFAKEVNTKLNDQTPPSASPSSSPETRASTVASLAEALSVFDKYSPKQENKEEKGEPNAFSLDGLASSLQEMSKSTTTLTTQKNYISPADGFCAAVSLNDGRVIYTTSSITSILGYPNDSWEGRSFLDFIRPKDRLAFSNKITQGVIMPYQKHLKEGGSIARPPPTAPMDTDNHQKVGEVIGPSTKFYSRLRKYNGLQRQQFAVRKQTVEYAHFSLVVYFKQIDTYASAQSPSKWDENNCKGSMMPSSGSSATSGQGLNSVCIVINAVPLRSAYNEANDNGPFPKPTFVTTHLASYKYSMVEENAIPYLGYLPQDIENSDIFSYYHPQDLDYLKEVYNTIVLQQGKPFQSRPYRFKVQNGGYILLETESSCFINPWSKLLEFVTGTHTVLQGPPIADVFYPLPEESDAGETEPATHTLLEEPHGVIQVIDRSTDTVTTKEIKSIQGASRLLLTEATRQPSTSAVPDSFDGLGDNERGKLSSRRECFPVDLDKIDPLSPTGRRRKEITLFMGSLLEEMAKPETSQGRHLAASYEGALEKSENPKIFSMFETQEGNEMAVADSSRRRRLATSHGSMLKRSEKRSIIGMLEKAERNPKTPHEFSIYDSPPSYTQLNYKDNLSRFFSSQPKTVSSDVSGRADSNGSGGTTPTNSNNEGLSPREHGIGRRGDGARVTNTPPFSGDSGDNGGTSDGVSAIYNIRHKRLHSHPHSHEKRSSKGSKSHSSVSGDGSIASGVGGFGVRGDSTGNYTTPFLTEEVLRGHNCGQERMMIQHYKDAKKQEKNRAKAAGTKALLKGISKEGEYVQPHQGGGYTSCAATVVSQDKNVEIKGHRHSILRC